MDATSWCSLSDLTSLTILSRLLTGLDDSRQVMLLRRLISLGRETVVTILPAFWGEFGILYEVTIPGG